MIAKTFYVQVRRLLGGGAPSSPTERRALEETVLAAFRELPREERVAIICKAAEISIDPSASPAKRRRVPRFKLGILWFLLIVTIIGSVEFATIQGLEQIATRMSNWGRLLKILVTD